MNNIIQDSLVARSISGFSPDDFPFSVQYKGVGANLYAHCALDVLILVLVKFVRSAFRPHHLSDLVVIPIVINRYGNNFDTRFLLPLPIMFTYVVKFL